MKILIFGYARSRTSLLQDVLSKHYNLQDLWEPYNNSSIATIKWKIDRMYEIQKSNTLKITEELMTKDNFVTKLFIPFTFNVYKLMHVPNPIWTKDDFLDLSKYFNIHSYDKIYCLHRENYTDFICSFLTQHDMAYPIFLENNKRDHKTLELLRKQKPYFKYSQERAFMDVFENVVYKATVKKLIDSNLPIEIVEYNNVPTFISQNFPSVNTKYTATGLDYKNQVRNYNEIEEKIKIAEAELLPKVDEIYQLLSE